MVLGDLDPAGLSSNSSAYDSGSPQEWHTTSQIWRIKRETDFLTQWYDLLNLYQDFGSIVFP